RLRSLYARADLESVLERFWGPYPVNFGKPMLRGPYPVNIRQADVELKRSAEDCAAFHFPSRNLSSQ
ncbi:MAG: hypothetical protein ACERJ2_09540, partial [Filomicrobium sp.]